MSEKFTSGPWKVAEFGGRLEVIKDATQTIAAVGRTNPADASLIAAAPDLYAACKELREALAASFRVIARVGEAAITALELEIKEAGVKNGVGVRAQEAVAKAEGATK